MIENNLLTENVRDGRADAWRDYQQILAEIGLIYSTRLQRKLRLTRLGKLYLAGEIGFSDLMTQQSLRYQYPNGQKSTIQSRLRQELTAAGVEAPETLTELHAASGVRLRPGVLALRVLIECFAETGHNGLSVDEIINCLMPIKSNADWPTSFKSVIGYRAQAFSLSGVRPANRRNAQDWTKFLGKSAYFSSVQNGVRLSETAVNSIDQLRAGLSELEEPSGFWLPGDFKTQDRLSWFDYFGAASADGAAISAAAPAGPQQGIEEFAYGPSDGFGPISTYDGLSVELTEYDLLDGLSPTRVAEPNIDLVSALANLQSGILKKKIKTALHDEIIDELAQACSECGGKVFFDPNSVDLLVTWPDGTESVFEVKTVTQKSYKGRIRSALGQVKEYAYRRLQECSVKPEEVIVIDIKLTESDWRISFLNDFAECGLACRGTGSYVWFLADDSNAAKYLFDK